MANEDGSCSEILDAESQYLMDIRLQSKRHREEIGEEEEEESGWEWDKYKENVRPSKRGRNVTLLNHSLRSHSHPSLQHSLLHTRSNLIQAIDDYKGDDPLLPWLRCIKWVQDAYPAGGDSSGLLLIYEQCVRAFWHHPRYKDDLRYLQVWLQYAENCADAQVIYTFLDANNIGHSHSLFYISYALHMEAKHKIKTADDIFNQGLSINAQPKAKLEAAYRKFLARSMRRPKAATDEDSTENGQLGRSFGTVLSRGDDRRNQSDLDAVKKTSKGNGGERVPLSVYKDTNGENSYSYQLDSSKMATKPWDSLPTHKDRNKENKAIPAKWTSYKIPQRPGSRLGGATQGIQVFVDEDCSEVKQSRDEAPNASNLHLKERDEQNLKRETELLKENPLRNFPTSSFPR